MIKQLQNRRRDPAGARSALAEGSRVVGLRAKKPLFMTQRIDGHALSKFNDRNQSLVRGLSRCE
jgi:hypothetical protein